MKNNLIYRYSTYEDTAQINNLLKLCFGDRSKYGALNNIENRYLLAYINGQLVAMTGICDETMSEFNGCEIDWTCCHPDYRNQGIITNMLGILLKNIHTDIYCSCLKEPTKEKPNLHTIMTHYGFTCIQKNYKTFDRTHDSACNNCNLKKIQNCKCHEDLYFRKKY